MKLCEPIFQELTKLNPSARAILKDIKNNSFFGDMPEARNTFFKNLEKTHEAVREVYLDDYYLHVVPEAGDTFYILPGKIKVIVHGYEDLLNKIKGFIDVFPKDMALGISAIELTRKAIIAFLVQGKKTYQSDKAICNLLIRVEKMMDKIDKVIGAIQAIKILRELKLMAKDDSAQFLFDNSLSSNAVLTLAVFVNDYCAQYPEETWQHSRQSDLKKLLTGLFDIAKSEGLTTDEQAHQVIMLLEKQTDAWQKPFYAQFFKKGESIAFVEKLTADLKVEQTKMKQEGASQKPSIKSR